MLATLLLGFVSLSSGCGGGAPEQTATVIVYQESPTVGTVQVLWNGKIEAQSLAFQKNTRALTLPAGPGTLKIIGQFYNGPPMSPSVSQWPFNLAPNSVNDVLFYGGGLYWGETSWVADTTPAEGSAAKLRLTALVNYALLLNAYILPSGETPSGNPNYVDNYKVLSPGTYDIFFTCMPTDPGFGCVSGSAQVQYKTTVTLAAHQNRTLVLLNVCPFSPCDPTTFASIILDDLN